MKTTLKKHTLCAAIGALTLAASAHAERQSFDSWTPYLAACADNGIDFRGTNFTGMAEGIIEPGGVHEIHFLAHVGCAGMIGLNPWVDYFGHPSDNTLLFIDDPQTQNTYGTINFDAIDGGTNPRLPTLRCVTIDAAGQPLIEEGGLESGVVVFVPGPDTYAFAISLFDVEVPNDTQVRVTLRTPEGLREDVTIIAPAPDDYTQFVGLIFDHPIEMAVVRMGSFPFADGVVADALGFGTRHDVIAVEPQCPGDLDGNGVVNTSDLTIFLGNFGKAQDATEAEGDFTQDAAITTSDLVIFLEYFGHTCEELKNPPPPADPPADPPTDPPTDPPADPPKDPPSDPPADPPADPPGNPPAGGGPGGHTGADRPGGNPTDDGSDRYEATRPGLETHE